MTQDPSRPTSLHICTVNSHRPGTVALLLAAAEVVGGPASAHQINKMPSLRGSHPEASEGSVVGRRGCVGYKRVEGAVFWSCSGLVCGLRGFWDVSGCT